MSFEEKVLPNPQIDSSVLKFCNQQPDYKKLNENEKQFYYWVNYSRTHPGSFYDSVVIPIIKLYPQLNGEYLTSLKRDLLSSNSLPMLLLNPVLLKMAKEHAVDITSHNMLASHTSTNGDSFSERFKKSIIRKCGGENIGYGANDPVFLLLLLYLDIDLPDLGHRKALLNPNFIETGIGSSFYKNGLIFLVEDFACSTN